VVRELDFESCTRSSVKMPKVSVINLTKRFGALEAVKNLSLEVEDGKFVCILGPSGCGKTTTLRMIAGLETQDSGDIYIGDRLVNNLSPRERDIAMVFQFYAIYPGMSVYENLAFPLIARKIAKEEIDARVKKVAGLMQIDHLLNSMAMKLTVGEKQRVALGRAVIRQPQVYLLDEPLTNLDARLRAHMRVELKKIQRDLGQTTIYVTHDQLEAMTMADKIAVMSQGELQQFDTPENVYDHPRNLFVAGFVGSATMNFLNCTFEQHREKVVLDFGQFSIDISHLKEVLGEVATGSELILGIRPEDIVAGEQRAPDGVEAKVDVVEPIGDKVLLDVLVGNSMLKVFAPPYTELRPGDQVWLFFDRQRLHVIEKKTEEVLT